MFENAELIHAYTRADAIDDGTLVDVTDTDEYREAGFRHPVAITRAAWNENVALPDNYSGFQDVSGRLWDVLWMTRRTIAKAPPGESIAHVELYVREVRKDGQDSRRLRRVKLWAVCGPGDDAEPTITIMRPEDY